MKLSQKDYAAEKIREFSRFFMPKLDLLNKGYLKSEYSIIEARIIFELVENKVEFAHILADKLMVDKSYLSRILKKFERNGLIVRKVSSEDARFYNITPTEKCVKIDRELSKKSSENVKEMLSDLSDCYCEKITDSINTIMDLLSK